MFEDPSLFTFRSIFFAGLISRFKIFRKFSAYFQAESIQLFDIDNEISSALDFWMNLCKFWHFNLDIIINIHFLIHVKSAYWTETAVLWFSNENSISIDEKCTTAEFHSFIQNKCSKRLTLISQWIHSVDIDAAAATASSEKNKKKKTRKAHKSERKKRLGLIYTFIYLHTCY